MNLVNAFKVKNDLMVGNDVFVSGNLFVSGEIFSNIPFVLDCGDLENSELFFEEINYVS